MSTHEYTVPWHSTHTRALTLENSCQGWGEFVTADGDVYEGQWRLNVRHGKVCVCVYVCYIK
jgi:hypothetical protein